MSFSDDTCDFCQSYCDPIGCDTSKVTGKGYWCGQCREGNEALFGKVDEKVLQGRLMLLEAAYDANPIDWHNIDEDLVVHAQKLALRDTIGAIKTQLKYRYTDE